MGFNLLRYDNAVLAGYLLPSERHLVGTLTRKTVDLHTLVLRDTGERWSLERIAQRLLGVGKLAVDADSTHDEIAAYCERDVELTRDLDDLRRLNGGLWV